MAKKKPTKKEQDLEGLMQFLRRRAKYMRTHKTVWEQSLFTTLKDLHYNFKCQVPIICRQQYGYILDFLLTDYNLIIEVDSVKHHTSKQDVKKDNQRTRRLRKEGYEPLRLTNKQISLYTKEQINEIIQNRIKCLDIQKK